MKWLYLPQGTFACVDDDDYEWASKKAWFMEKKGYVREARGDGNFYLARMVMRCTAPSLFVDHISGNKLDNRKQNLRIVTRTQNAHNVKRSGICFHKRDKRWIAKISGKWIGYFPTEEEAREAYKQASLERSDYSVFNRPDEFLPEPTEIEKQDAIENRKRIVEAGNERRREKLRSLRNIPVCNNKGERFFSVSEAARKYGFPVTSLTYVVKNGPKEYGGINWWYDKDH